ncbi:putative E3 ubiquitin-protein ligase HERC4 [Apostichopus japonicus]|uniref:Putative E3 ubiquitin-protein ligase HERC4 n=1 Tax=Stichopus japonicus TaxID=307972 RepID=A0A2G8K1G1_STIJA|nr:putative E3 ubiquitin-protein ligase HERC4 [Apostichopus japonicus]
MEVVGWGETRHGQLGMHGPGSEGVVATPQTVQALNGKDIADVSCGSCHSVFVLKDGSVYSCGANDKGQLGQDRNSQQPEQITALETFFICQVSCGLSHNLAVTEKGKVLGWGQDNKGQCGFDQDGIADKRKPRLLRTLNSYSVVQVSCGDMHSALLTKEYSLGVTTPTVSSGSAIHPLLRETGEVTSLSTLPIVQVVSGGYHCMALTRSGTMFAWGKNSYGQLGLGDCDGKKSFPFLLKGMRTQGVQYISCGQNHTVMLTFDGGVFTCGLGCDGQLGHGQASNELRPKKVFDLMDKEVTQISCGRAVTLAYIASSGQLVSFGDNRSRQLGQLDSSCILQPSPGAVAGNWVRYPPAPGQRSICAIYSGGNHCLCVVGFGQHAVAQLDHREFPAWKQTTVIDEDFISRIVDSVFDEDVKKELQDLFSSASCLNRSFLKKNNEHFGSSRQNHGVDLDLARTSFSKLHTTKAKQHFLCICNVMENSLFPSLPMSPPDIEALRLYLLLMEFPLHDDSKTLFPIKMALGLARCLSKLQAVACKVLMAWWSRCQPRHFRRVVKVYQRCIVEQLKTKAERNEDDFIVAMQVLQQLNTVNNDNHEIIPFNFFYINELSDLLDLREHFIIWFQKTRGQDAFSPQLVLKPFTFCDFPFVFDVLTKSHMLHVDALIQMQLAMEKVQHSNLMQLLAGQASDIISEVPWLVLEIDRRNIVASTIQQLSHVKPEDFKKPLRIAFRGEDAIDAGGVKKEFFMLIMREILDPKYGMFKFYEESRFVWFNRKFFEDEFMFRLVGMLCGLAIYNHTIIALPFPPLIYKKLLNRLTSMDDFKLLEPTVARHLQHLMEYEGDDVEDVFCLSFEYSDTVYGTVETNELIPGGSNIAVTKENKEKYVDCYVDFVVNSSVQNQFGQFRDGFLHVCGGKVLDFCHPDELQVMVVGDESYDWDEFQKSAVYKGEYYHNHNTIKMFWKVFRELDLDLKKKFLVFLTGSDRIPIEGMKSLKPTFQPIKTGVHFYPVAHTCFNLLDLPMYEVEDDLREKLLAAIAHASTGFTIV